MKSRVKILLLVACMVIDGSSKLGATACDFENDVISHNQTRLMKEIQIPQGNFSKAIALIVFQLKSDGSIEDVKAFRRYNGLGARVSPSEKDFEKLERDLVKQLEGISKLKFCPWQEEREAPVTLLLIFDGGAEPKLKLDCFWTMVQFESRNKNVFSPVSGGNLKETRSIKPGFPQPVDPVFPGKGNRENWEKACFSYGVGLSQSGSNDTLASSNFKKAIDIYPWEERFYRALGALCIRNKDYKMALQYYKDGMRLAPKEKKELYKQLMKNALSQTKK